MLLEWPTGGLQVRLTVKAESLAQHAELKRN
jgi:hypothetical protein